MAHILNPILSIKALSSIKEDSEYSYTFIIISENEEHVINALKDDNVTILLKNINEELMTKNAEIDEGMLN